jgi:hypothetical protein
MRPQRVYPVVVRWKGGRGAETAPHPVEVRLIGGGAQIVPSEATLDPSKPDKTATFYMTPLALGPLRGVRLEVVHQGRKVQEIPMSCKSVRQRGTLILLLLTFLVPWLLTTFKHSQPFEDWYQAQLGEQKMWMRKNATSGEALQHRLDQEIPPVNDWIFQNMYPLSQVLTSLTSYGGQIYDVIYHAISRDDELGYPYVAYWAFWILLALTVCSFLLTLEKRKRKVGKPVVLPAAAAPARQAAAVGAEAGQ